YVARWAPERGIGGGDAAEGDARGAHLCRKARKRLEVGATEDEVDVEAAAPDIETGDIAHEDPEVAELPHLQPHLLHDLALVVVAAEGPERVTVERLRPRAAVMRTCRTPGTARISPAMAWTASSIAGIEMPSGPLMVASNSLSSTSVGVYSCLTQPQL